MVVFAWRHVLTRRTPMGRKEIHEVRFHGGPMIRVKREDLAARGVERNAARMVGVRDGMPLLDDGTVVPVTNVVWCTGFRQVFDWIDLPVVGEDGWPVEFRGVVDQVPGLFFCGLCVPVRVQLDGVPGHRPRRRRTWPAGSATGCGARQAHQAA